MGRDGITGLVVLIGSLGLFAATLGLERNPMVPIGPAFYPRLVLGLTATMAALLVVLDVLEHRRGRVVPGKAAPRAHYGAVVVTFAVFAAYVVALPFLGFRVATLAFMAVMQGAIDRPRDTRGWVVLAIVSVAATFATYYVFEHYLQVLLPRGSWTGF